MHFSSPAATLAEFATTLFASGQAAVQRDADLTAHEDEAARQLAAVFATVVEELPGTDAASPALSFSREAGLSALRFLYRLCLALADRAMTEAQVRVACAGMPPPAVTADELLSVDLALRHLPEIHRMARSMSESDPLIEGVEAAATRFPLSSVGIPLKEPADLALLQRSDSLWRLYLDRVLERQDVSRLDSPAVRAGVRDALGMHSHLAPKLAAQLALTDV